MSDWHWRFGRCVTAGCLAVAAAWPLLSMAQIDDASQQSLKKEAEAYGLPYDGKGADYVERLPDGSKVLIVKWEVAIPKNIVKLRIPEGYASPDYVNEDGRFLSGASFDPRTALIANEFPFQGLFQNGKIQPNKEARSPYSSNIPRMMETSDDRRTIYGYVRSAFNASGDFQRAFAISRDVELKSLISGPMLFSTSDVREQLKEFSLSETSGLAGLRRVGVEPMKRYLELCGKNCNPKDFYFTGDRPETAPIFILCTADVIDEPEEGTKGAVVPQCRHNFLFEPVSALIELTYRRELLGSWREIQQQTEQLLLSFLAKGN